MTPSGKVLSAKRSNSKYETTNIIFDSILKLSETSKRDIMISKEESESDEAVIVARLPNETKAQGLRYKVVMEEDDAE